ncbi:hypothetical protein DE146DRAFT_642770 [Phaeosphaeria sp. MPI-PUGE-AT-0046c]|nr:hypothetical protein DE146DRAFT_642770 [Phaeosphaeria sp. MPI-PUGE-AT-0046c]
MVRIIAFAATLAFALTALAAPNPMPEANALAEPNPFAEAEPASCGGQAIRGSDCSFNDQCKSCKCKKHLCL